ncbi:hypothetical protein J7I94_14645 [Streptomyces sp. ISL-12]|uniref:hypothetical protein n=1 Tax=Streptomyces sp. ISL-12 TaxID=2819177 RepID=UPI001BE9D651|nr:hypothetical protein [Streptomyces sp. ISL-12]MBT2411791.1 hypothetical protein [Streptomyces sp. ISL-12]
MPDFVWKQWPDWNLWDNILSYPENNWRRTWSVWNAWTPSSDTGELAMADQCRIGRVLHRGGPEVKALAMSALAGSEEDRAAALTEDGSGHTPITLANDEDWETAPPPPGFETEQQQRWQQQLEQFGSSYEAPELDTDLREFRRDSHDRAQEAVFADLVPRAGQESVDRVASLIAETKGTDEYFSALDTFQKEIAELFGAPVAGDLATLSENMSADDARMFLQYGGFPTTAPEAGSLEFRTEVEALKTRFANCDPENPADPYRALTEVVETARAEWQAELDGQEKYRNAIVAAEAKAYDDMWNASEAMVEAVGQAWVAETILSWQRNQGTAWEPTAAQKNMIEAGIANAQSKITAQINLARKYTEDAKTQAVAVDTAEAAAAKVAEEAGAPRGRGLAYAQQSAQVTKASSAGAEAALKAAETALEAAKATVADSGAVFSRAKTEAHALEAQYRRAAAEESARQAELASDAAAEQADLAAKEAAKAKDARERAEAAEAVAKAAAADASAKRKIAESERDNAAAARKKADAERAKAAEAEERAKNEQANATAARERAESAGTVAAGKRRDAVEAENRAGKARDEAIAAEERRDSRASRAHALEAAAAAAVGTADAEDARAAATEARAAADDAQGAADRARSAADDASEAAIAARAAATEATAAASRAESAADAAERDAATTRAQVAVAHAAAADAIEASKKAAQHVKEAEEYARAAAAEAVEARAHATAARAEATAAKKESARTAGFAMAASQAAAATRDAATRVIDPANEAISLGSPYQETDASAGMAVLVGQQAKSLAAQQAAAADAKAEDAAEQAQAAEDAAAAADKDAKLAAEAAARAAASAAKAAGSVQRARASAAAAAQDATAAQEAEANTIEYDRQANADAVLARSAANDAQGEASAAWDAATEAEKDAAGAHDAADAAQAEASIASEIADLAERDATAAEEAAANAQASAAEADQAATRAEEQLRQELQAQRAELASDSSPDPGTAFTSEEEQILLEACGQTCVDQYRAARATLAKDVIDWVKENGGEILLDVIGVNDARKCFSAPDVESCLWTLIDAASLLVVIGKLPAVSKAVVTVGTGIGKFFEANARAKRLMERLRTVIKEAREKPKPPCTNPTVVKSSAAVGEGQQSPARSVQLVAASEPCPDLDVDLGGIKDDVYNLIDGKYGPDVADGVDYNFQRMHDGSSTAGNHSLPGIGHDAKKLAEYLASWRGKATHYDVRNPAAKVAYDTQKGVIIIMDARMIHAYTFSEHKFLYGGNYAPLVSP